MNLATERRCEHGIMRNLIKCPTCDRRAAPKAKPLHLQPGPPPIPQRAMPRVPKRGFDYAELIRCVAESYGLTIAGITKKTRYPATVEARSVACWLARDMANESFSAIGRALGRDQSSMIHAFKKCDDMQAKDPKFKAYVAELKAAVEARMKGEGSK
jgi:hypothetical protein